MWVKRDYPGEIFFLLKDILESIRLKSLNLAGWNEIFSKFIFICILTPKDLLWPAQASLFPNFRPFFLSENRKP